VILEVSHRTHYRYAGMAAFSQHLLRLTPLSGPGQRALDAAVRITPEPDEIDRHTDMFGNVVHVATVARAHDALEIIATSRVDRSERNALILDASVPWEQTRAAALGIAGASPLAELAPFAFPSQMTAPDRAIESYARESFPAGRPVLAAAAELSRRIHRDFAYLPGTTAADTLAARAFALRQGVCQDFAHVLLAALRSLRVPARYVSGYLRTVPRPGRQRLVGADASHAWVAVWDPGLGWVELDPTNDCVPGEAHVALAIGRDYGDVAPVSGLVVGAGQQTLTVGVDVAAA
jgi:transglutaminase-like putative cysteine protease